MFEPNAASRNCRILAKAAAAIAAGQTVAAAALTTQAAAAAAVGGALSGGVASGTLKGALLAPLGGFTFHQIGISSLGSTERVFAHALAGGTLELLGGGKFGHGFVSAGLSKALSPLADTGDLFSDGLVNAAIGGTVSEITGGDFGNGAVMAAMQYAFNELARGGTGCAADPDCSAMLEEIDHEGIGRQNHAAQFVRDGASNTVEASNQLTTAVKENSPAIAITLFAPGMLMAGGVFRWGLSMSQTKYMLRTAQAAYKGSTVVGHALAKHAQRNPQIWGKLSGGPTKLAGAGMQHLREILSGKGQFQTITDPKTGVNWLEKRLPDGRGVRLQMDYMFKGFID